MPRVVPERMWKKLTIEDIVILVNGFERYSFYFKSWVSVQSYNLSLKYQRFTLSGNKDIGIRKFDFVAKTQFFSPFV